MSAYKFLEDGQVVWAGKDFFYYNERRRQPIGLVGDEAIAEKAQLIQGSDQTFYHTDWLHDLPEAAAGLYEESDAVEISDVEYTAIKAILDAGGTVEDTGLNDSADTSTQETVDDTSLDYLKEVKITEMSAACSVAITSGVDVVLVDEVSHHFSLTVEDQLNLASLQALFLMGQTSVPYHADGEQCRYFSATEFNSVVTAATTWKMYHESYYNSLCTYILAQTDIQVIAAIAYGDTIPEEYQSDVLVKLTAMLVSQGATVE